MQAAAARALSREAEFEALVPKIREKMIAAAYGYFHDQSDAEEAAQDALGHGWAHLADFRGETTLAGWLFQILRNQCKDIWRKRQRRIQTELLADVSSLPYFSSNPESQIIARIFCWEAFSRAPLTAEQAEALVLWMEDGNMDALSGTDRSRIFRAKAEIRRWAA